MRWRVDGGRELGRGISRVSKNPKLQGRRGPPTSRAVDGEAETAAGIRLRKPSME
jgi:hypothetical protein